MIPDVHICQADAQQGGRHHFTPEGEIVLRHIKEAARELETMRQEIGLSSGAVAGTLRAAVSINYAMYRLPEQLLKFQEEYPQVSTHVITSSSQDAYKLLLSGAVNVAILRGEFEWSGEKALLERERVCAITSSQNATLPLVGLPQILRRSDAAMERDIARCRPSLTLQAEEEETCSRVFRWNFPLCWTGGKAAPSCKGN